MAPEIPDITRLLHEWRAGSHEAENELFARVMPDLRRLASYLMGRERRDHSLQATELVNQIYIRLVASKNQDWENRRHFFAIAARAMRRHLIDHARGRPKVKFTALPLDDLLPVVGNHVELAVTIDSLLEKLDTIRPEWCRIVEMKYFLGLGDGEAAEVLGIKVRTLQRGWRDARQWLFEQLESIHGVPTEP